MNLTIPKSFASEADALAFLRTAGIVIGSVSSTVVSDIINCDTPPTDFPGGWVKKVLVHQPGGQVAVSSLKLYQSKEQRTGGSLRVDQLIERCKNKQPGTANMAIHLYHNPHLIPEEWKQYYGVAFTGTTVLSVDGGSYVLCLFWRDGSWRLGGFDLGHGLVARCRLVVSGE